jgi:feruloyl-CoA synthase
LRGRFIAALTTHARENPANSTCVARALLLTEPLSIDHGEITDKGSVNQRAVLTRRASLVAALYEQSPPAAVLCIA